MFVTVVVLGQLLLQFHLNLLNFQQPLPLVGRQQVELGMKVANVQLGFQVDAVIVIRASAGSGIIYRNSQIVENSVTSSENVL